MEKIESHDKVFSDLKPPSKSKLKEFFSLFLKLTIGICSLPVIYAVSVCFVDELMKVELSVSRSFTAGVGGFLGVYLFVWEPVVFYKKGQKMVEALVKFFSPLVKVAPFVLPIYTMFIFTVFLLLNLWRNVTEYIPVFMFLIGFSLALHLVFSAKTLRSKQGDSLKSGYLFGFSLIYILDVVIVAAFFNSAFGNFSFLSFFNSSCQISKEIFAAVFKQLFVIS